MRLVLKRSEIPAHLLKFFRPIGWKPKDEIDTPGMLAEALREDGWYRRSTIIWHKKKLYAGKRNRQANEGARTDFLVEQIAEVFLRQRGSERALHGRHATQGCTWPHTRRKWKTRPVKKRRANAARATGKDN